MSRIATIAFMAMLLPLSAAIADDAAAPSAQETIPSPNCHKPVVVTKMRKADDDSEFQEKADAYKNCINAYVDAQTKLSQLHVAAANAAIAEFNAFVKAVNSHDNDKSPN
ncbi:MAG: hypothetical protein OSA97_05475 [Nevskia sp.]|nr:hypothetical protein [Nevskia sp.]